MSDKFELGHVAAAIGTVAGYAAMKIVREASKVTEGGVVYDAGVLLLQATCALLAASKTATYAQMAIDSLKSNKGEGVNGGLGEAD